MKALIIAALLVLAGCAHHTNQSAQPDGYYNNESKWQEQNRHKQEACVLRIIEIAPPTATAEELDYNLKLCLLHNDVFILNNPPPSRFQES